MIATSSRHYQNAPITEAILDLRVLPRQDIMYEELAAVVAGEEKVYPTAEAVHYFSGQMMVAQATSTTSTVATQVGYVFRAADGRYIHQARTDGFTVSQLPKYSSWKDLEAEARKRWTRYWEIARPLGITRAALRYINRIDVPAPLTNIDDYLHTSPRIASGLPQTISGYFMQVSIPYPQIGVSAIISETIIPPARPDIVSIVLDIDVFKEFNLPATDEEVWSALDQIHGVKNKIFEACITDKARELFV